MSDDEENFCYFGKPLDPYDEDAVPKKRPISIEDQIATDAQGRRRFHGAFTGGFSAGFFNTVGSLEGWTPSEFKSTRQDKAKNVVQKPQDFMDQEDLEEYGIAPQTVRATQEFSTSRKRRKQVFSEGPIPGIPVLETLLTSGNETIGYLLLKKIGMKDKIKKRNEADSNLKMYGCQLPDEFRIPQKIENLQYKIPEIYTDSLSKPKSNTFGLGYEGLERTHVNLFTNSNLVVTGNNNKKFSIAGQAFGVGAFEEDDDDIYKKEDMSNYDFELGNEKQTRRVQKDIQGLYFGMFKSSNTCLVFKKKYPPPTIPHSFTGKHKVRKSRFESIEVKSEKEDIVRSAINPAIRARYLGEEPVNYTPSQPILEREGPSRPTVKRERTRTENSSSTSFDITSLMTDRFVSASQSDHDNILEPVPRTEIEHGTKDMREAAKMNMYGPLTRVTIDWTPCAVLCKRFNVPEPRIKLQEQKSRKRTKNLIFENQKYTDDKIMFKPGCSTNLEDIPSTSQTEMNEEHIPNTIKTEQITPEEEKEINLTVTNQDNTIDNGDNQQQETDEVPKDITEKIGIEEKVDLFKAVFLSSSESEDEEEEISKEKEKQTEEFKEILISDLIPKIKPLKQGILSNLTPQSIINTTDGKQNIKEEDSVKRNILFVPKKDRHTNNESNTPAILPYGPQLPTPKSSNSNNNVLSKNLTNFLAKKEDATWVEKDEISSEEEDTWIEKDESKKGKHKHKKKHKKNKKHKHSKKSK